MKETDNELLTDIRDLLLAHTQGSAGHREVLFDMVDRVYGRIHIRKQREKAREQMMLAQLGDLEKLND